jgi:DNA-binding XRE family transcriptional regulator
MKNEQQEEAKKLYFQTNMSKTEIANAVGVCRRTILRWCKEDNWEQLRKSARHMPSIVAEKCYYLLDAYASRLLQHDTYDNITLHDAQVLNLLASTIKKIKNRSTTNESMEMFNFFLEGLKKKDPKLAEAILPELEEYIQVRGDRKTNDYFMQGFTPYGMMEYPEKEINEQFQDAADLEAFDEELKATGNYDQAIENWEKAGYSNIPQTPQNNTAPPGNGHHHDPNNEMHPINESAIIPPRDPILKFEHSAEPSGH